MSTPTIQPNPELVKPTQKMKSCRQCYNAYEPGTGDDGFCSDPCLQEYNQELAMECGPDPEDE